MVEYIGKERRKTPRKEAYLPIKLTLGENIVANGHTVDINCFGIKMVIKLEMTFKVIDDKDPLNDILYEKNLYLEIGKRGSGIYMKTPAKIKWSEHVSYKEEKFYEAGLDLQLNKEQKEEWFKFYNKL